MMSERFWFIENAVINNTHPIEPRPVIIGFLKVGVNVEVQRIMGHWQHVNSIVTIKRAFRMWGKRSNVR
jgi:hypothetical protein